jgi:hypothetical protein
MGAGIYMKSFLTDPLGNWTRLADTSVIVTATIVASSRNTGAISIRVDGGASAAWYAGATVRLEGVDLSRFEMSGPSGHNLLVVGHTR